MKFCIALYDWPHETNSFSLAVLLKAFMDDFGTKFLACVSTDSISGKVKRIRERALNEFLQTGTANCSSHTIEIFFGNSNDALNFARDWKGYLSVSFVPDCGNKSAIVCWSGGGKESEVEALLRSLSEIGNLSYGIGFSWSRESDPSFHAVGITHGFPATEAEYCEADEDRRWREERTSIPGDPPLMRHKFGMFRDVYELNIVNATHLSNKVNGVRLSELVLSTRDWGSLSALRNENWVWRVPKERIPAIRFRLSEAGCLLTNAGEK